MKKLSLLVFSICLFLLTGCITIIEKYSFNKDGSGTMEYMIDMSELYNMMAAFADSSQDMNLDDLDKSMRDAFPGLSRIEGISNIVLTSDISKYTGGIRFDFKDISSLNRAMSVILEGEESTEGGLKYVNLKGKKFTRYSMVSGDFNKDELLGKEDVDEETMNMMLESMKYKISVTFPKPVKKVSCDAPFTRDKNEVTIEANFSDIFSHTDFLKTEIRTR